MKYFLRFFIGFIFFFVGCDNKKEKEAIDNVLITPANITVDMVEGKFLPKQKILDNETLLGIDANNNRIRDDIELKIFDIYKLPIHRAIMLQAFRTEQIMLSNPYMIKHAKMLSKVDGEILGCIGYLEEYKKIPRIKKVAKTIINWQYNNKKRAKKYSKYNRALSGGVYSIPKSWSQYCQFDIDSILNIEY